MRDNPRLRSIAGLHHSFSSRRSAKGFGNWFKVEHGMLADAIVGVPDEEARRSYASVVLNRLLFIYLVQKKGFLDGDADYLRAKMSQYRRTGGESFYRGFLCPLFFEGLAKRKTERSEVTVRLLGNVPYLGSGLFARHIVEEECAGKISIGDPAIERILDFFDAYRWHVDGCSSAAHDEIELGVLGNIYEEQANRKQTGSYYTREDAAQHIVKNTLIPRLFDIARRRCGKGFEGETSIWRLIRENPDRYFYPAARKGTELPLPPEIAVGLNDVPRRTAWSRRASEDYALPTETWRETVARRLRYEDVKARLIAGEARSMDNLVTCNLDIARFAGDALSTCEDPEFLQAFYEALERISVLDPTCGSGAFMVAALAVLEPLYLAGLERMQVFLDAPEKTAADERPEELDYFRRVLDRATGYPSLRYFIAESIAVNNLFGLDISAEAVQMCRLRLLLEILAQVKRVEDIVPLPDISANIRAGNALLELAPDGESPSWGHAGRFQSIVDSGGFDVVVGNPPYVEYSKDKRDPIFDEFQTGRCGNLCALVVERSLDFCCEAGRFGLIVQLSSVSTKNMAPLQGLLRRQCDTLYVSSFAERPQQLFPGACIPQAILLGRKDTGSGTSCRTQTTGVYRWHEAERDSLFQRIAYCAHGGAADRPSFCILKLGSNIERAIREKLFRHGPISRYRMPSSNGNSIYFRTAGGRYWKVILSHPFETESTANKAATLVPEMPALAATSMLSSSLFWWYYTISFDLYNLKDYVLFDFRFDCDSAPPEMMRELVRLGEELMTDYRANANRRTVFIRSKQQYVTYCEYLPRRSKRIIDAVDRVLARYYGFTDEELDFIVNYDGKYRMGLGD